MGKILVITEKPSVARDIARVLGVKTKQDGYLEGEQYLVSWAIGHLITLCDPEEYSAVFKKWQLDTLPILPEVMKLKAVKKTMPQLKVLKKLMNSKEVDSLICATDAGREGELIFRYIYHFVGCKKRFQRLWISSMTDTAILDGFAKLKEGSDYDALYQSAKCRSEADWLVGINASRAYTIRYRALLSIGRVQTPTLSMIVARQKEIDAFVPEEYYEIEADFGIYTGTWFSKEEQNTRIKKQQEAERIVKKVQSQQGCITEIKKEEKRQVPPLLYDLTELQRDCNRYYGFSAKKTLTIAQSLYETKKMITYPRTDSRYLSSDMIPKITSTLKKLAAVEPYQEYAEYIIKLEKLPITSRIIDDKKITDHHAIIPTELTSRIGQLSAEEQKVYQLVVIRFLCVFFPAYITELTKVITTVLEETFLSKGTVVLHEGYMRLYRKLLPESKKKKTGKEKLLPAALKEQEQYEVKKAEAIKKKTTPPNLYTEATLLSAMENAGRFVTEEALKEMLKESGLGTPATRAAIIERLLTVGYIMRKGKSLVPTEKGMALISAVPTELQSPETTGKWEKGLSSIAKGTMQGERFMESIRRYVQFLVEDSKKERPDVTIAAEEVRTRKRAGGLGLCPQCKKGKILENTKAYYCTGWKEGCKFTIWKNVLDPYGKTLSAAEIKKLLKDRKLSELSMTLPQTGEACTATLVLKEDNSGMVELRDVTRLPIEKA